MRRSSTLTDLALSALLLVASAACAAPVSQVAPRSTSVPSSRDTAEATSNPSPPPASPSQPAARESECDPHRSDTDLIASYTPIWRAMLAQKNGVSPADVDAAVPISFKSIERSEAGTSLVVRYRFALDWASVDVRDEVVVRVDSRHPYASSLGGKLDRWLSASEAATAAGTPSAPTTLARLPIGKHLKFTSSTAARAALSGSSHTKFDEDRVRVELAWPSDKAPSLFLTGVTPPLAPHEEMCEQVHLNLVTGEILRGKIACAMVF
jgi:hypothetical protein